MDEVEALLFDVFGTVVDWRTTVTHELEHLGRKYGIESTDWEEFAQEWRHRYLSNMHIAAGGSGSLNLDTMHREILDDLLCSVKWSHLGRFCDERERQTLNNVWHRLDGMRRDDNPYNAPPPGQLQGWEDSTPGLHALKQLKIIATLSNGNVRLLVDLAKHANLPWDAVFSAEFYGSYKPNRKTYLGAANHLSLPPQKCAMVAAHLFDLRAAAEVGMKTVYIRRPGESDLTENVMSKADGGEVDIVASSLVELALIIRTLGGNDLSL